MQKSKYSGIIIILAIVMAICVFLPFMSASDTLSAQIDRMPNIKIYQGLDYTAKDLESPSLVKLLQVASDLQEKHNLESDELTTKIICTAILVISSLVAAVFASKKDAKKVIIFVVIAMLVMFYLIGDMEDGGAINPDQYQYGLGIWVFLAASIAAIVCAVMMKKEIAQAQQSQQSQYPYAQ